MRPRTIAIVPAAGFGKRLGLKTAKPFVRVGGKPLVGYALETLSSSRFIDGIIVAVERRNIKRFAALAKRYGFGKIMAVVAGGKKRSDSVRNCLEKVGDDFDIVLIHDAARPFLDEQLIRDSINAARRFGAGIAAVPESDTVKMSDADLFITKTLDRRRIFRAQTPQAFRKELIKKAYAAFPVSGATDDSALTERLGEKAKIIKGSYGNIKITTMDDLRLAQAILSGNRP